jgi:arylformamidase
MIAEINSGGKTFRIDLSQPLDISIPLNAGKNNVNAFYIPPVSMEPFTAGNFIGDVSRGGSCNVFSISFNPHGNGTHTETVGHISKEKFSLNKHLGFFFFMATLITVDPEKVSDDSIITKLLLKNKLNDRCSDALIIRTLPNEKEKLTRQYSGTNPPYLTEEAALYIRSLNVQHLILDLPSIDREEDDGKLLAHHAFWNYPQNPRINCTITELAYIPDSIPDGEYFLNLMIASFENDASPSKPVLYGIMKNEE